MLFLLCKSALRFHLRHPWQLLLALAGISLGVAAFIGIQAANRAAERAFELSSESFRGRSTHSVIPVGGELPVATYEQLVRDGSAGAAAPVIARDARLIGSGARRSRVELIGVDPIEEIAFERFFPLGPAPASLLLRLIAEPRTALATPGAIPGGTLSEGDTVTLEVDGRRIDFEIIGELGIANATPGGAPVFLTDIASLDMLTGGGLSRIDLALEPSTIGSVRSMIAAAATLVPVANRNSELEGMTSAFTTNLTALGLLALVVGLFLIHATMSFSIVRRRSHIATLRGLGLGRRQLIASIAAEAAAIGVVAGAAGALLGQTLASLLIDMVLRTMSDLAFSRAIAGTITPWWSYPAGIGIGIATTLVAAIMPAREAAALAPAVAERRSDLERHARSRSRRFARLAVAALLAAAALLVLRPQDLVIGFAALFLVLIAGAMCVPIATSMLMRLLDRPARAAGGVPAVMAVRAVTASLSRTGVATAALAVAVATVISIGLMVDSFRGSLIAWIDDTLTADLYVLVGSTESGDDASESFASAIARLPGVAGTSRSQRAIVPADTGDIGLRATEPGPKGWGLDLVPGYAADWSARLASGDGIVVAEPYAYRHRLDVGQTLSLPTANGRRSYPILGIARDYNTAGPAIVMSLDRYRADWNDAGLSGIGVHLEPATVERDIIDAIDRTRPAGLNAAVRSTESIRAISLTLFDRTFEITSVLRALAGVVAFFGVLSAILALQMERRREFSVLRSIGMSLGQLRAHVIVQTSLLGLAAGTAALPIGCILAWLLVFVINRRAFGWSMSFDLAPGPLAYGMLIALAAAGLSGLTAAFVGIRADSPGSRDAR